MKYGAIDMGTNSVRLLIAETNNGKIVNSFKTLDTTRIGENVDKTKIISVKAMERTINALKKFKGILDEEGIDNVSIIATSAVRDSTNANILIDRVEKEIGMKISIISGEREAELGYLGVKKGLREKVEGNILVIDIGGGSTELIVGDEYGIKYLVSLDIGAVRLTEKIIRHSMITEEEFYSMVNYIDDVLKTELDKIKDYSLVKFIGIGGTATTLAAINQNMTIYDQYKIHNYSMTLNDINEILKDFKRKSLEERKKIPGLQPKRADVIIAGTTILTRIMENTGVSKISISEYDNLEGMVFEQMQLKDKLD